MKIITALLVGFIYSTCLLSMLVVQPVIAVTYEEFQFQLSEAVKQRESTAAEVETLTAKLAELKSNDASTEERKTYSIELLESLEHLEKLRKEIERLRTLLPEVEIAPILKLVQVLPGGAPGQYSERFRTGSSTPHALVSLRFKDFPTEIVAGRPFSVSGEMIWRESYEEGAGCKGPVAGVPAEGKIKMRLNAYRTAERVATPLLGTSLLGKKSMRRFCNDAPVDIDPATGKKLQAGYEKDSRVSFSSRFIPVRTERDENGRFSFAYKLQTTSTSDKRSIANTGLLFAETQATLGNGACIRASANQFGSGPCNILRITMGGAGASFDLSASLVYRQIQYGEPYIGRAPTFSHPAALGQAPTIGAIKISTTVPDIKGFTRERAEQALADARLKINYAASVAPPTHELAGLVRSTVPKAGARIRLKQTVSVITYTGLLSVPQVIGVSVQEAKQVIEKAGFVHKVQVSNRAPSKDKELLVTRQMPPAGSRMIQGEEVTTVIWDKYVAPQLTPNESCHNDWPGSVSSGKRSAGGGWDCQCPSGMQWNTGKTACVKRPSITPDQSCHNDWPGSISSGKRSAGGGWDCECPAGMKWNAGMTACIKNPSLTPDQSCHNDWPGSISSGERSAGGGWNCECPDGKRWNQGKTACEDGPGTQRSTDSARRSANCHPWQIEQPFLSGTICECRYGRAINSLACLPPVPSGHRGCPPGTRKEYSYPDRLGLGCECIHGSEKGVCKLR